MGPSAAFKGASGTHASTVAPAPGHRAAADMLPAELVLWFSHSGDSVSAPPPLLPRPYTHQRARPCGRLHGQPLTQLLHSEAGSQVRADPQETCSCRPAGPVGAREMGTKPHAPSRITASPFLPSKRRAGAPSPQEKRRSVQRLASAQRPASPRAGPSRGGVTSVGTRQPLLRKPRAAEGPLQEVAQGAWAGKPRLEG